METQKIIFHAHAIPNESVGGEEYYDDGISVEVYIKIFEDDVKRRSGKTNVVMDYISITDHDEDGNFKRDEKNIRQQIYLYRDGKIISQTH